MKGKLVEGNTSGWFDKILNGGLQIFGAVTNKPGGSNPQTQAPAAATDWTKFLVPGAIVAGLILVVVMIRK